ncbi:hypothetical protein KM043_010498 [Ampulex compressa]|nr:hypothetical protein KM043_010498 [Ampulex compressa]
MRYLMPLVLIALGCRLTYQLPVSPNKKVEKPEDKENEVEDKEEAGNVLEYHRYLKEVIQVLESDNDFRDKLDNADEADIRSGKIADELHFVNHNVRTALDELKRDELERLRHLVTKENQFREGLDFDHLKIAEHVDHTNAHSFEANDLKKLIIKTTKDLAEADKKRREMFKKYEMQRKYEEQQKLQGMNDLERKKYEDELTLMKEKHKKHEPLHHPGSKQQLEEVWEKQDHMEDQDFNPKTFFHLHDLDGNGFWDQDEVKILFLKELDKLYQQEASQNELLKRHEEMERMREHVFAEADENKDGLISYEEFLQQTKRPDFQNDEGWEGLDEQQIFSPQEYEAFERRKQEEIQKMISKGMPSHPADGVAEHHGEFPPQYAHAPSPQGVNPAHDYVPHAEARIVDPNSLHQAQLQSQHNQQPHTLHEVHLQQQYPGQVSHNLQGQPINDQVHPQQVLQQYQQQQSSHQQQQQQQQQQHQEQNIHGQPAQQSQQNYQSAKVPIQRQEVHGNSIQGVEKH